MVGISIENGKRIHTLLDTRLPSLLQTAVMLKQGQNYEAEAEAEIEANFWRLRPRLRPKIIINNIRFKIIAGKTNKIHEFYTIFAPKMSDYTIRTRSRPGRGQMFKAEAEAEAKILASRPLWPQATLASRT